MATSQQEVIDQLQEVVAARDAFHARVSDLTSKIAELREKVAERREQQEERLDLMREAYALLATKGGDVPGGRSLFDLNRKELRALIGRLDAGDGSRTRGLFGRGRQGR